MDIPRKILKTLFTDTSSPLIQHHVDSFNDMLDVSIPTFMKVSNPIEVRVRGDRIIRVYIGGKDGTKYRYESPTEDDGTAVFPHTCRLDNRTYALSLRADITIEYTFPDNTSASRNFEDILIGEIPLMLRSKLCYLTGVSPYDIGECKYEIGGYFIIDGSEKILMTQELLGNNMFYVGTRKRKAPKGTKKTLVEEDQPISMLNTVAQLEDGDDETSYDEIEETYVGIKTLSEDGVKGPYYHFLVVPATTIRRNEFGKVDIKGNLGRDNRLATIQLGGFSQPVPVMSVFRALGVTSDRDIYETVLADVPDRDRNVYDETFYELMLSHDKYLNITGKTDMDVLRDFTKTQTRNHIISNIYTTLFTHAEGLNSNAGDTFRHKAYLLGHMLRMALDVEIGRKQPSDRDNMRYKRLQTSGVLCFEEFKRNYREIAKNMLLQMDSRVQYESRNYEGKKLVDLVELENVQRYWRGTKMLTLFVKSFKGAWGGSLGIAQELQRPSYLSVIHHLRKTSLQIEKSMNTAPPRRLYASQYGIMCPIDSPDGSEIGYYKALAILARVSIATPVAKVKEVLTASGMFRAMNDIHPSTWNPSWTKIFVNSDLVGACIGNTEELHQQLQGARRTGVLDPSVSLGWMRINNEYIINCDAGRPLRPVFREGTTPDKIRKCKTWTDIMKNIDYIDAVETDSLLISMEPFHPTLPSEIHMSFNMSALANMVPFPDHNPGPRSVFSIAQQKAAAGWYHTNYNKRFDTAAMMLTLPQKPMSQTWLYQQMLGNGGCLGYGENAIVAITMYGGHNQEDSVIMNGGSLKRGSYQTMYYHSYDYAEESLEQIFKDRKLTTTVQTTIANPVLKPDVKRKEGLKYDLLDEEGIIRVGSEVDDTTVLVGMLSPIRGTKQFRDVSVEPKRGQKGRVDAVYRYVTQDGLKGVKVRIVEHRVPQIGDKMGSRHSQKGTVGMVLPEEDMPFTASGARPDIIFNPHGIPTRMTTGQFLEMASNKLGIHLGSFVDATPFSTTNRLMDLRKALMDNGFEPYGCEVMYNGQTGEMMEADIFMGPIYYQRLKQMVEDKINYRATGPKKALTHQPTQGRSDEVGMRIGEMERDVLIAHGMSKFLRESMMERSDKATYQIDKETGLIDTSRETIEMPYTMGLLTRELEAMHIVPRIETE